MQSYPVSQSDDNHTAYVWLLLCLRKRASHRLHSMWAATLAEADWETIKKSAATAVSGGRGKSAGRLQSCPVAAAALQAVEWPRQLVHIPT